MELRDGGGLACCEFVDLFGVLPLFYADPISCHQFTAASGDDNLLHPNLQDVIATNERRGRPCANSPP